MRTGRPGPSRRLIEPGDLGLGHCGRGNRRGCRTTLHGTSRLIPEASGGIMTADDDDAVLAAMVRTLGSRRQRIMTTDDDNAGLAATVRTLRGRSVGCRQDIGDVAGRATFAVAVRIRHFLTRIVQRAMDLQSAVVAMTGHVDNMSKAAVRAVAVATSGAVAAIAAAARAFGIRRPGNAAARITTRRPAGIAAARSVRLEVVGAGFIVADML